MRRWLVMVAALVALLAACGGTSEDAATGASQATTQAVAGDTTPDSDVSGEPTTTADATDSTGTDGGDDGAATTSTTASSAPEPEGDPAPDFTLALADGGEFSLSGEQKPVYLVFWAEW